MTYNTGLMPSNVPLANDPAVSDSGTVGATTRSQAAAKNTATSNSAIHDIASDSAKVSLAGAMLSQATTGSDVRFEKVAALRQSIEAGTYGVSSENVASKLVDSMLK